MTPTTTETRPVAELSDELALIDATDEVRHIVEYAGHDPERFGCVFVSTADGDYDEIWATESSVPWLAATAYKLR